MSTNTDKPIQVPAGAAEIIRLLNAQGFLAYVVGGCVRDSLLGLQPKDWDICTSATPEEMQRVFSGYHLVETGLKHGTLTVVINHIPYEVTTFRVDGTYTDHRHPDGVTFVTDVTEDLARRDFTVNAMAYHPETGLVDAFHGQEDLENHLLRCVGDAHARFAEDALRILRALRFSSVYGFDIEEKTAAAIHNLYPTLQKVAGERIRVELAKLLCGTHCGSILRNYTEVFSLFLPSLADCVDFEQHTPYHRYNVFEHLVRAVEAVPPAEVLRRTMLLHDIGKPACFFLDEQGIGHAYGHQKKSAELAVPFLQQLHLDTASYELILLLITHHDIPLSEDRHLLLRRLNKFGEQTLRMLLQIHRADAIAKGTESKSDIDAHFSTISAALDALLAEKPCFTLKDLAVNGRDLLAAGVVPGPAIGQMLESLLTLVMEDQLPNEKSALIHAATAQIASSSSV